MFHSNTDLFLMFQFLKHPNACSSQCPTPTIRPSFGSLRTFPKARHKLRNLLPGFARQRTPSNSSPSSRPLNCSIREPKLTSKTWCGQRLWRMLTRWSMTSMSIRRLRVAMGKMPNSEWKGRLAAVHFSHNTHSDYVLMPLAMPCLACHACLLAD